MTKRILAIATGIAFISISLTSPTTGPCGEFSVGNYKLDVASGEVSKEIPRDMLNESIKAGLSFNGTSKCPGEYELVDLLLTVHAEGDPVREYDLDLLRKMQSMEDYILVRYFFNAQKLTFTDIKVKNSVGEVQVVPSLSLVVE